MKNRLFPILALLFLLLGWELLCRHSEKLLFVLPPPSSIFLTLSEYHARLLFHSSVTFSEMLAGFLLALTLSFPLAWLMFRLSAARALLQPLFILIQCLPMFTLAPLMVIWFGWNFLAIVIPTALMIFLPLTLSIYQGFRSVSVDLVEFFESNDATKWQLFSKLYLPASLPHLFAGLRISSTIAGIGAIGGEWAGAQNGLGILMLESRRNMDLEVTFSALFALSFMSFLLYSCVIFIEKSLLSVLYKKKKKNVLKSFSVKGKPRIAFWLFCFLLFILQGCTEQKKPLHTHRLLLDWLPNPNHVPLFVGVEKKFFEEEGILLTIQKLNECGGGISYLTAAKADLLVYHMPGTLKACHRGAKVFVVGTLIKEPLHALIYLQDAAIKQPSDLSGKKLGYCLGGPDTTFLDYLLQDGKIELSEKKNVGVELIAALGTKNVQVIFGGFWNIEPEQLKQQGIRTHFFKMSDFHVPNYYEMIVLAAPHLMHQEPDFAARFQKALQKSIDFCKENPSAAFAIYEHQNPDKRKKTLLWEKESWNKTVSLLADDQSVDLAAINELQQWLIEKKIISKPTSLNDLIKS